MGLRDEETDCRKCCVSDFKNDLCKKDFCEKYYREGSAEVFEKLLLHWIPCSERLPEEHDSIFKRYYGTDKWINAMFQSHSKKVITTCEFADGTRFTETNMTCDGKWRTDEYPARTVIAWMPLPEPYQEGEQND